MMKNILTKILIFICVLSVLPQITGVAAESTYYPEYGIYFDALAGEVTGADAGITSITVPEEIGGVAVTRIRSRAFYNCTSLIDIELPKTLNSIGAQSFVYTGLTEIIIPENVKSVEYEAFRGSDLKTVIFDNCAASIGNAAFRNCSYLEEVDSGTRITSIGAGAFSGCKALTEITFPESLVSLANEYVLDGGGVFEGCTSLKTVIFNNCAATIGENAFEGCTNLTKLIAGDKLKGIGEYAFWKCSNLTEISLGVNITSIGSHAFDGCSRLTQLLLPASLAYIGTGVFNNCSSLMVIRVEKANENYQSIDDVLYSKDGTTLIKYPPKNFKIFYDVPEGVTSVSPYAFHSVTSLEKIFLPETLSIIGESAFRNTGLTKITIPKNVSNVGYNAFRACLNLKTAKFNNCVATIGNAAFRDCWNLSEVDFGTGITRIGAGAFSGCKALTEITFPESLVSLADEYVLDGGGVFEGCTSLKTVIFNNCAATIGEEAFQKCTSLKNVFLGDRMKSLSYRAFNMCSSLESITIPASVEEIQNIFGGPFSGCTSLHTIYGYIGTAAESHAMQNGFRFVPLDEGYSETGRTDTTVVMYRNGSVYDLLSDHQIFAVDSEEKVTIIVKPDWFGVHPGKILISQSGDKCIESETGVFLDICPAKIFDSDGKICIILVTEEGKTIEFQPLQMQIVSTPEGEQSTKGLSSGMVNLLEFVGFDIPDSIPILGGKTFGFELGSIKAEAEVDGNQFKIVLGSTVLEDKKDEKGKWKEEDWQGFKAGFKEAKEKMKEGVDHYTDCIKKIAKKGPKLEMVKDKSRKITVAGYLEGYIDEVGEMKISEGGIIVDGGISYDYEGMIVLGIVPLCYEVGAGGKLSFSGGVKGYIPEDGIGAAFTGSLTPSASFEAGGGVGIPYLMSALIKGKLEAALEIALDRLYQNLSAEGSASFKLKGPFDVVLSEKKFAKNTWHIYETGNPDTLLGSSLGLFSINDIYDEIDMNTSVLLDSRDYLKKSSEWTGDISRLSAEYTNKQLSVLEENTYPDIQPVIAYMEGTPVMVWITDSSERNAVNKCMLVYSVYDEQTGTWSIPVPVADNGAPDFYPEIKDGYLVWQKANTEFDESVSVNDMSIACEIYAAKWNGSGFGEAVSITENNSIDTKPMLTVKDGTAYIIWTTNTEDNFMGTTGTNSILACTFDGVVAGEQSVIAEGLTAITHLSANYGDSLNIYYSTDADNDYSTATDRDIYLINGAEHLQITDNEVLDSNPIAINVSGEEWLFWYSGGDIFCKNSEGIIAVSEEAEKGFSDKFDIITNESGNIVITQTGVSGGGTEVFGLFYDGKSWSKAVQLSEIGENIKYSDGIMDEEGNIILAFNRTEKIAEEDYYTDGKADLCTLKIAPSYDLAVCDAVLYGYELKTGENTMLVDIANKGEMSVSEYEVVITDENGNILGEYCFDSEILAGEELTAEVNFNIEKTFTASEVFVSVYATEADEYNTENNSFALMLGEGDVKIAETMVGENTVVAIVKNAGFEAVSGITVNLLDKEQEIIQSQYIDTVAGGESAEVQFDFNLQDIYFEEGYEILTVSVHSQEDSNIFNNDKKINISEEMAKEPYEISLHSISVISDGNFIINTNIKNCLQTEKAVIAMAAIYTGGGKLVAVSFEPKTLSGDNYTTADFSFNETVPENDYKVKLFIWNDLTTPVPSGNMAEYGLVNYLK